MAHLSQLTSQYTPPSLQSGDQIARETYEQAKNIFDTELTRDEKKKAWLNQQASLEDVQKAISEAASNYRTKSTSNSAALRWLMRLSGRIQTYGVVLDVLVQHHPEYVSLAWGAFKFLFTAVINHETLTKELSKTLTKIADILPQADIDLQLYPTAHMKNAVARLYACLLRIAIKALRWYKQGRLGHVVGAIFRPWELEFEDEVSQMKEQFANVTSQASLAARAELRDVHVAVRLAEARLATTESQLQLIMAQIQQGNEELKLILQGHYGLSHGIKLDVQALRDPIQVIAATNLCSLPFAKDLPSAGSCLEYCMSFQMYSRSRSTFTTINAETLEDWSQSTDSTICTLKTTSNVIAKNAVTALVRLIRDSNCQVVWALRFSGYEERPVTTVTILRMLVLQVIQRNQAVTTSTQFALRPQHLEEAADEQDWLRVFGKALEGLPQVFVILDSDLLKAATGYDPKAASKFLEMMLGSSRRTVLKILVPALSVAMPDDLAESADSWTYIKINEPRRDWMKRQKRNQSQSIRQGKRSEQGSSPN